MYKSIVKLVCLFLGALSINCFASIPTHFSLAPMIEKASPAVVNIKAQIKVTDYETILKLQKQKKAQGTPGPIPDTVVSVASGVIMDAQKGYIITNSHVVEDAQAVTVTLSDGRHYTAKIIGMDKASDVALLQIHAKNLTTIPISDSSNIRVGDLVVAIGNPFGLNQTVSSGIISALGRTSLGIENYENFIQTDAPINPGNSGGALINSQGELVGINTAIIAPNRGSVGIGFAIPSDMAKSVMKQLIEYGNVRRGALGIGAQDITPELAAGLNLNNIKGAAVTIVKPNSPAAKAGIKVGDIITSINNSPIKNANDVVNAIAFMRVDTKATLQILRNNKPLSFVINITDPKKTIQENVQQDPLLFGVSLKNFNILSPIHGDVQGVLVVSVEEDTNAWHSDLRPGDVIVSANQGKVSSIADLKKIASGTAHDLVLNVLRGPGAVFLVISKE